jgi:hypothetical protein
MSWEEEMTKFAFQLWTLGSIQCLTSLEKVLNTFLETPTPHFYLNEEVEKDPPHTQETRSTRIISNQALVRAQSCTSKLIRALCSLVLSSRDLWTSSRVKPTFQKHPLSTPVGAHITGPPLLPDVALSPSTNCTSFLSLSLASLKRREAQAHVTEDKWTSQQRTAGHQHWQCRCHLKSNLFQVTQAVVLYSLAKKDPKPQ